MGLPKQICWQTDSGSELTISTSNIYRLIGLPKQICWQTDLGSELTISQFKHSSLDRISQLDLLANRFGL